MTPRVVVTLRKLRVRLCTVPPKLQRSLTVVIRCEIRKSHMPPINQSLTRHYNCMVRATALDLLYPQRRKAVFYKTRRSDTPAYDQHLRRCTRFPSEQTASGHLGLLRSQHHTQLRRTQADNRHHEPLSLHQNTNHFPA